MTGDDPDDTVHNGVPPTMPDGSDRIAAVETVLKLGGGVLADTAHFDAVLAAISAAATERRLLIVPGGGPFADAVREVDRRIGLSDDAAHWMAVLAMDQYAHLVTARLAGGVLVRGLAEIAAALGDGPAGIIPVLAPYQWLRQADPLPHTWAVTGDSIAAWVAGAVGARRLVLVKPAGASGDNLVDDYFAGALQGSISSAIVAADRIDALRSALRDPAAGERGPK
jgi:aspartokinase-like uncharacterized kinase